MRRKRNLRKSRAYARVYSKEYRRQHPEQCRAATKNWFLQSLYGITLENYRERLAAQEGRCAICGTSRNPSGRALAVDHNHATGHIRGLLCCYCNTAVGQIERVGLDNLPLVVNYLKRQG